MIELLSTTITVNLVALISFIVLCCTISNILNLLSFKKLLKQILDEKKKSQNKKVINATQLSSIILISEVS